MEPKLRIASITDEFSPTDFGLALDSMAAIGMTGAELRVVFGKNIMDLTNEELGRAKAMLDERGIEVISIASPILKCTLENGPAVDTRFQQDMFNAKYTMADQAALAQHAFAIAKLTGAKIIRVFSYWRTVAPEQCFDAVVAALRELADQAAEHDLIIGLENEHACNIATAAESAPARRAVRRRP